MINTTFWTTNGPKSLPNRIHKPLFTTPTLIKEKDLNIAKTKFQKILNSCCSLAPMESQHLHIDWLRGIRVVLIGNYVPAHFAAYLLRMLGAEVIKVEQGPGDHLRY